jgi:hypothetical protein
MGATAIDEEDEPGRVAAEMPPTWRSMGERVQVVIAEEAGLVDLQVSSWSIAPTVLIDYGKNRRNVEELLSQLRARLNSSAH